MKRKIAAVLLALAFCSAVSVVQPAAADARGCKDFGQNVAGLASSLGVDFGQTASGNAPLNGVVAAEQAALCGPE